MYIYIDVHIYAMYLLEHGEDLLVDAFRQRLKGRALLA